MAYTKKPKEEKKSLSTEEAKNAELAEKIFQEKEYYLTTSRTLRRTWVDCYKAYRSFSDQTQNPYLANLYIPKTHEATELLAAFLVGPNQSITTSAEGVGDTKKAAIVEQYLDFIWRKVLKVRDSLVTWVKQGILFGNGIMKVTWDPEYKEPCVTVISLPDIYFDYYFRNIQESPRVIHRIIKNVEDIKNDERYNEYRNNVVSSHAMLQDEENSRFDSYDNTISAEPVEDQTEIFEAWSLERLITIAPTMGGYRVIRDIPNPYKDSDGDSFIPFVKVRFKTNPLPNRAYDIGAIEPTLKIQMAFNDAVNEFFDNATLINNKIWIKRRGANINPMDLQRKPGIIVTVNDINNDLKAEEVSDIKPSMLEMIQFLDSEFQQASMVVNILKGIPNAQFAAEVQAGQANVQTILDLIDQNIQEALSELGSMVLDVVMQNVDKIDSIKVLDTEDRIAFIEGIKGKDLLGKYDVRIQADRSNLIPKVVKQKQMLDFIAIITKDPMTMQRYPDLLSKVYKRYLENSGEHDISYFFEQPNQQPMMPGMPASSGGAVRVPARFEGLTPSAIQNSASPPNPVKGPTF